MAPEGEPIAMLRRSVRVRPRVEKVRVEPGEFGVPVVDCLGKRGKILVS